MGWLRVVLASAVMAGWAPVAPASHVPDVPRNTIIFQGDPYRAWWYYPNFPFIDSFRLLCAEPCPVSSDYMSAKFAGFQLAHQALMPVTGIDILPRNWPFDLHMTGDPFCGPYNPSGGVAAFAVSHANGSAACFWTYERSLDPRFQPLDHNRASTIADQGVEVHEYAHVIFYGRHWWSYENVVSALGSYISRGAPFDDPCYREFNHHGRGRLVYELCEQHGFQWSDLAPALVELDALYQAGGGYHDYPGGPTAAFQLRRIFDAHFGESTQDAFRANFIHPTTVGDEWFITHEGGDFLVAGGAALLSLPADAISFPMELRFVSAPPNDTPDLSTSVDSRTTIDLAPTVSPFWQARYLNFFETARLTYKYRGYDLPDGIREPYMHLQGLDFAGDWNPMPGSFTDLEDATVSAEIDGLGTYAMAGPRTTSNKLPAQIVPLVLGGSEAGEQWSTTLRLSNPVNSTVTGRLVFRADGRTATAADPSMPFSLGRRETLVLDDIAGHFGEAGAGNVDVFVDSGYPPEIETRVLSDDDGYTHGGSVKDRKPGMALRRGEAGVLLVPRDLQANGFSVGIRTLSSLATLKITVYAEDGSRLGRVIKSFPASRFQRQPVSDLVGSRLPSWARFVPPALRPGIQLQGGESLFIEALNGEVLVAGDTINLTGDIDLHYARPLSRSNLSYAPRTLIPSTNAAERESFPVNVRSWETRLRLHNPTDELIRGQLVLRTVNDPESGTTDRLTADYAIAPHATHAHGDVPALFAICAIGHPCPVMRRPGSLEIVPESGPAPVALARVVRTLSGFEGVGYTQEAVSPFVPVQSGEISVLPVADETLERSLGLRTFDKGVTFSIYNDDDPYKLAPRIRIEVAPQIFREFSVRDLMGDAYEPGRSVRVRVEAGRALMWSIARDPVSGDPTFHQLRRFLTPI